MTGRVAIFARERPAWRLLALAAALSALLGVGLTEGLRTLEGARTTALARASRRGLASLSPAGRASISAALGAKQTAYHFTRLGGGFKAANPAQHVQISAGRSGVLLRSRGLDVGLALTAIAYGHTWHTVRGGEPAGASNRLSYTSNGVDAWYLNGPFGVEQGFTLARPDGAAPESVTLAIAVSGDARASLSADGQTVRFSAPGARALRYGGLSVSDAAGRTLPSRLALEGKRLVLDIDTRDARYPLRVDPSVESEAEFPQSKLSTQAKGSEGERTGASVALSANGDVAVVGAPDAETDGGAVWVFRRSATGEFELEPNGQGELASPEEAHSPGECLEHEELTEEGNECAFGRRVAISANGETIAVGAPLQHEQHGAAWIYTHSPSGWQAHELSASGLGAYPREFGRSVALSANGETAIVGAPGAVASQGTASVFTQSGSGWEAEGEPLKGEGEVGPGRFGVSVALSSDGDVAVVGAPADENFTGAAWVFERSGAEWRQEKLERREELAPGGHFGYSVALSGDGDTALVGAPLAGGPDEVMEAGTVSFFAHEGEWVEQSSFSGVQSEQLGLSVALSPDGSHALVGAPFARVPETPTSEKPRQLGRALEYERSENRWTQIRQLQGRAAEVKARFGRSVALATRGETALVGGPGQDGAQGAAWVFDEGPAVTGIEPEEGLPEGGTDVKIKGQHFVGLSGEDAVKFGDKPATSYEVNSAGLITALSPPGGAGTTVNITVQTPLGTSEDVRADEFTYRGTKHTGERPGKEPTPPHEPNSTATPNTSGESATQQPSMQVLALGPKAGGACSATLLSKKLTVRPHATAVLKLRGSGAGTCRGRATLTVKLKLKRAGRHAKHKTKTKIIGTTNFAITAGKTLLVKIKLNATGRALLAAGHGRMSASLLVLKSSPTPRQAHTASVRLTRQPGHRPKKRKPKNS
ncbi:MAG TPA: IPT/TIG domain-containing protein [Solirubrobacteraceae bacterium]|nr:IPT/TIG domain-containing protein [Solirubrobacteraceae bacterium]